MSKYLDIKLRSIKDEAIDFLYQVYHSTRVDELGIRDWQTNERDAFLQQQFKLQHIQYMQNYNNPSFDIIVFNGIDVGRLYVNRNEDDIRIIDITLLKEYRGQGIGRQLIGDLIEESEEKRIPLSLHVEHYNFAREWYKRLGFKEKEKRGVYIFMKRNIQNL